MTKQFLVTVKFRKNPSHDPHNKITDICPAQRGKLCTDSTGEHHTVLWEGDSMMDAMSYYLTQNVHVTRIEEV